MIVILVLFWQIIFMVFSVIDFLILGVLWVLKAPIIFFDCILTKNPRQILIIGAIIVLLNMVLK